MDSFLNHHLDQGALDSSGAFTIHPRRALHLSRLATQPRHYPVLLVALAVLQGASRFDLRFSPGRATVTFDGSPLAAELLETLPGQFFSPSSGPQVYLTRALQAAMLLPSLKGLRILSGDTAMDLLVRAARPRPAPCQLAGTRLELSDGLSLRGLLENPQRRPETAALQAHCRWAPLRLQVNDQPLWEGLLELSDIQTVVSLTHPHFSPPRCAHNTLRLTSHGNYAGLFWFRSEADDLARLTLVENGLSYGPVACELGHPGCQGVLVTDKIPKDLSWLSLRQEKDWVQSLQQQLKSDLSPILLPSTPKKCTIQPLPPIDRAIPNPLKVSLLANDSLLAILGYSSVKVWTTSQGQCVAQAPLAAHPDCATLAVHPLRPWLVAGGAASLLLDASTGQVLTHLQPNGGLSAASFGADGGLLACGSTQGWLSVHRLPSGHKIQEWKAHTEKIRKLGFHPNGEWLFSADQDGKVHLWTAQGKRLASPPLLEPVPLHVQFSPQGDLLAVGGALYRCPSEEVHLRGKIPKFREIRFLGQGESVAGLRHDRPVLEVRRSGDGQLLWTLEDCHSLLVSSDGQLAVGTSQATQVMDCDGNLLGQSPRTGASQVSPRWLLFDGPPTLTNWSSGQSSQPGATSPLLKRLDWGEHGLLASGPTCAYRVQPDSCQVVEAVVDPPNQVTLSDDRIILGSRQGLELRRLKHCQWLSREPIASVAASANLARLVAAHRTGPRLEIWDTHRPQRLFVENGVARPWALSQDGALLALGNPLRIIPTNRPADRIRLDSGPQPALSLFLTSTHLVQTHDSGTQLFRFQLHPPQLRLVSNLDCSPWTAVAFRPDGQLLAGLDGDGLVHFRATTSGQEVATWHPLQDELVFTSPDHLCPLRQALARIFADTPGHPIET
ncbi:WD40 repeat domain-containing protein [bacterium]|nr:WD40 repeat domain-containing protein [bacterium]